MENRQATRIAVERNYEQNINSLILWPRPISSDFKEVRCIYN